MSSDSSARTIERLMAEGLDAYGSDRVERAVECWRTVLRLDPGHEDARDFLRSAGFDDGPAERPMGGAPPVDALVLEALELFREGAPEAALELIESLQKGRDVDLRVQGYVALIRSHLHERYLERLRGGDAVPRLAVGPDELLRFNLPSNAGFVLSMLDGATSVNDLVALSGMDPFDVLHTLHRLGEAGIVEVPAGASAARSAETGA